MIFSSDVLRIDLSEFSLKILAKANRFLRVIRAKLPVDCNSARGVQSRELTGTSGVDGGQEAP